jgi:hypothetical protein
MPGQDDFSQIRKDFSALQTQVERLSEQVSKSPPNTARNTERERDRDDDESDFMYLNNRKMDEFSRFFRGLVFASLEATRVAAESLVTLTSEATSRNMPKPNESMTDVARRLPVDITRSFVDGIDTAIDIPNRAVQRFNDVYRDPAQVARGTRRRARHATETTTRSHATASRSN